MPATKHNPAIARLTKVMIDERSASRVYTFTTYMKGNNTGRSGFHFVVIQSWDSLSKINGLKDSGTSRRLTCEDYDGADRRERAANSLKLALAKHDILLAAFRDQMARVNWRITGEEEATGDFDLDAAISYVTTPARVA